MDIFQKRQFFQLIPNDDNQECFDQKSIGIELATYSHVVDNRHFHENELGGQRIHSERNLVLYTNDYRLHLFQYGSFIDLNQSTNQSNNDDDDDDGKAKKWRHWIIPLDSKKGRIVSMCMDQSGEQLLAITNESIIYVIPFYFITYYDQSIDMYRTVIEKDASLRMNCCNNKTIVEPTSIVWWQRNERYVQQRLSIAVIGTKRGQISMIDLDTDQQFNRYSVPLPIESLNIYDEMYNRSLLITCAQGKQYQLILEEFRTSTSSFSSNQHQQLSTTIEHCEPSIHCLSPATATTTTKNMTSSTPLSKLSGFFTSRSSSSKESMTKTSIKNQTSGLLSGFNNYYLSCLLNLPFENENDVLLGRITGNPSNTEDADGDDDDDDDSLTTTKPQLITFNNNESIVLPISSKSTDNDVFSFNVDDLIVPLMQTASHQPQQQQQQQQQQSSHQNNCVKMAIYPPRNLNSKTTNNNNNNIYVVKYQNCAKLKLSQTLSSSSSSNITTTTTTTTGNEADFSNDSDSSSSSSPSQDLDFLIISKKSSNSLDNFCNISIHNNQMLLELYEFPWQKFCTKTILLSSARLFSISLMNSDTAIGDDHDDDHGSSTTKNNLLRIIDCSYRFLMLVFSNRLSLISKTFSEQSNKSHRTISTGSVGGVRGSSITSGSPRSPLLLKRSDSSGHRRSPSSRNFQSNGNKFGGGSFRRKLPGSSRTTTPRSISMSNISNSMSTNCSAIAEFRFDEYENKSNEIIDVFLANQQQCTHGISIRDYLYSKLSMEIADQQQQQLDHQERYLIELLSSTDLDQATIQLDEEFLVVTKYSVYIIESKEKSFGRIFHSEILSFLHHNQEEEGYYQDGDLINRAKFLVDCFSPSSSASMVYHHRSSLYNKTSCSSIDSPSLNHQLNPSTMVMIPSQSWQLWLCRSAMLLMNQIFDDNEQLCCLSQNERIRIVSLLAENTKQSNDTIDCTFHLKQWIQNRMNQIFRLLELCRCPKRRVITALNVFRFWSLSIGQIRKFFHTRILFELNDDERNYLSWQLFEALLAIYQFHHHSSHDDQEKSSSNNEKSTSCSELYEYFYNYRQYYNHQLVLRRLIDLNLYKMSEYVARLHGDYLYLIYFILQYKCMTMMTMLDDQLSNSDRHCRHQILRLLTSKHVTYALILSTEFIHHHHHHSNCLITSNCMVGECRSIRLIERYLQFLFSQLPQLSLRFLRRSTKIFDPRRLAVRLLINQTLFYCNQTYLCNTDKRDDDDDDDNDDGHLDHHDSGDVHMMNDSLSESECSSLITTNGKLRKSLLPIKRRDLLNMELFLESLCLKKLTTKSESSYDWSFIHTVIGFMPKHLKIYEQKLDEHYRRQKSHQELSLCPKTTYFDHHIVAGTHCSLIFDHRQYCLWGRFDYTFTNSERLEQIFSSFDDQQRSIADDRIPPPSIKTNRLLKPQLNRFFSTIINDPIRSISIGYQHMMILTDNGIYGLGSSAFGQLGLGSEVLQTRYPTLLDFGHDIQDERKKIWKIVCGSYHTLLLSNDGHLYSFGWSLHGQLGHGTLIEDQFEPRLVRYFIDTINVSIADVAAGYAHTAALTTTGDLYMFGQNCYGQLGVEPAGCNGNKFFIPQKFTLISGPIRMICCGPFHTVVIAVSDESESSLISEKLYCWGIDPKTWRLKMRADRAAWTNNQRNMNIVVICKNQTVDYSKIREINLEKLPPGSCIQKMAAGQSHTLLLTDQGLIYTFGNGRDGQLGLLKQSSLEAEFQAQPVSINCQDDDHDADEYYQQNHFIDIACGSFHSLAIDFDGNVWGWGQNSNGQLFDGQSNTMTTTTATSSGDCDDLTVTLSHDGHGSIGNDSPRRYESRHITINLNSSSSSSSTSSNQMILASSGGSPKHNHCQPSILFCISNIMEAHDQNFNTFDYDNFTGWQIPIDIDDDRQSILNKPLRLQRKILLTILHNRHDLNINSLIRRFERLELYQLCSFVSWIANDLIGSVKFQFNALRQELNAKNDDDDDEVDMKRKKLINEISNLLKFYLEQIDLNHHKIKSSPSSSIQCKLTAKLLENLLQFWNEFQLQDNHNQIYPEDFIEILEQIFFAESMINPYFGPQLLCLVKQHEQDDIRQQIGMTDQLLTRIVKKSDELIRKQSSSKSEDHQDPIVTLQELFSQTLSTGSSIFECPNRIDEQQQSSNHSQWPLEIQWQNIVDEYLKKPPPLVNHKQQDDNHQSIVEIEISSDIENDPLLLLFKCGHCMTRTKFQSQYQLSNCDGSSSIEPFTVINQKLSTTEIDSEFLNDAIKDLKCIECYQQQKKI
ncbi:uncharacterized protein LOC124490891 [Dermatophagoides farinae]|uniref:uncharacterized protein LOC124490891 n=1 Tax=Dermatophagoides farinae TaxID=6954 RepID=UPI003F63D3D0